MSSIVSPINVKNTAMDGTWKQIQLDAPWNSVAMKMRETTVPFQVREVGQTNYFTVGAGSTLNLSSYNFSGGQSMDTVEVSAASGTLETLGFIREG